MKTINRYFNEALRVKSGTKVSAGVTKKTEFPETKEELTKIIRNIIEQNDLKKDAKISLNHIDVSKITNFKALFAMPNTPGMDAFANAFDSMKLEGNKYHYFLKVSSVFNGISSNDFPHNTLPFDISEWDMSNAEDISFMFAGSEVDCDLSNWDVSNVKSMIGTFAVGEPLFDISKWNVSKVEDMSFLFYYSDFDGDISNWDVSNVKYMNGMFCFSTFDGNISKWDVKNVVSMQYMFRRSYFDNDYLSTWDVSSVEYMNSMFSGSEFNGDISKWNVSSTKNMKNMFKQSSFDGDISAWDVSNVETMERMFYKSKYTGENGDIGNWKLNSIKTVDDMFEESNLALSLEGWKPFMKRMGKKQAFGMFYNIKNQKFKCPKWYNIQYFRNGFRH